MTLGLAIEVVVAVLLCATVAYCVLLNRKLQRLKSQESEMREVIGELVSATQAAERATAALKATASACDRALSERLAKAEAFTSEIDTRIAAGEAVVGRIAQITGAAGGKPRPAPAPVPVRRIDVDGILSARRARRGLSGEAGQ